MKIPFSLPQFWSILHPTKAVPVVHDTPVRLPSLFVNFYISIIFESPQILLRGDGCYVQQEYLVCKAINHSLLMRLWRGKNNFNDGF
jgi:hypothetical protein